MGKEPSHLLRYSTNQPKKTISLRSYVVFPFKSIKLRFPQRKMEIYHTSLLFKNVTIPYSLAPVMKICKQISTIVSHTSLGICFKSRPISLSTSKKSAAITHPNFNPAYPAYSNHDHGNRFLNRGHSKYKMLQMGPNNSNTS